MPNNNFILHGHFYQPPRENPWTGFIDRQQSAYPYNDWNTRINIECYAACTRTPVFDNNDVIKIINCFEYLSFNIGPTLLSWMEKPDADPRTVEKIIEGDKISVLKNYGHGNAIAQVYNHMIMPLASVKDQYTQIIWGLKDFENRFGRTSEGIWLSETAINNETAAILVDCGVKFVILSPYQVQKVSYNNTTMDVFGGKVDTSKPYKLHTSKGDLAVFFYDPYLASEISFGDLLQNSNNFLNTIKNSFDKQNNLIKLVHTATDGEVYGHHKVHGNMALARMIYDITNSTNQVFKFTNYGRFLADNPPVDECELYLGEDGKGSSWSCVHGVGRWYRDCACHTGGEDSWNQKWRIPLRESLDILRDELYKSSEIHMQDLLHNVWDARNDYYDIMSNWNPNNYAKFFDKHQKKNLSILEKKTVVQLMEALRYAMLMYTSCGWFFSDISGIETIQDLLYAARAYEFSKDILDTNVNVKFKNTLSNAYSNIKEEGNGALIFDRSLAQYRIQKEILIEYICWFIISDGIDVIVNGTNEFLVTIIWQDETLKRYILEFQNSTDDNQLIAFTINKCNNKYSCDLLWKEIESINTSEFSKDEFWMNSNNHWNISILSSLPLFLRIRFISRSIQFEINRTKKKEFDENTLFLNAIWGAETLLLPYEKRILIFYYAFHIYKFAQDMIHKDQLEGIEFFIREATLLQKSASSQEEAILYLEPIAVSLDVYLKKALKEQNISMLKNIRIIFWCIKDSIDSVRLDILRDRIYRFKMTYLETIKNPSFLTEFNTLMTDMKFINK